DPLYRSTFVGREQELKQLQAAFDAAVSGQGALTLVVGEPGIGKTALCEQLATYVAVRGGRTLVGHCYEEGSLSLPYLAFVEALHWADRGTLDLLLHVARNLQTPDAAGRGARLLVVGTYRDVEVDRAHPLSATLAELRRTGSLPRVLLRGLTVDEVHRMYSAIRGQEVAWAQAEIVHRQTEGNPLFVQEVLRYLVEEGYVIREGGRYGRAEGTEPGTGIPEGLRDVVGKRLNRLSEKTNQVLSVAAVMGREFRLDVLQ